MHLKGEAPTLKDVYPKLMITILLIVASAAIAVVIYCWPAPSAQASAPVSRTMPTIVWEDPQVIEVPLGEKSKPYSVSGRPFKLARDDNGGSVAVIADGRFLGEIDLKKQIDIGNASEVRFISLGKNAKVYLRFGKIVS